MKKLLLIIGIPVFIIIIAVAALLLFVDPNQFKPLIVEQTKKQTGMDLVIDGDIAWQIFPSLGLSLGKTELKNPEGFKNENLLKIDAIGVDVSVLPLLDKELFIGQVSLDGAEIYLETNKDGASNLDALTQQQTKTESQVSPESTASSNSEQQQQPAEPWAINLAGVEITNALLEIQDDSTGSYSKLYDVGLSVSEFAFDQWTTVQFAAKGQNNQQTFAAEGEAEVILSQDLLDYQLRNIEVNSSFSDPTTDISSVKLELDTFAFDQDNPLKISVQGNAADMDIELSLTSTLSVDKAISMVQLQAIDLDSTFEGSALPQSPMNVTSQSDFTFDLEQSLISLDIDKLTLNDIQLDGSTSVKLMDIPQIRFALHSPNIDLDQFLGLNNQQPETSSSDTAEASSPTASTSNQAEVEPDLSALKTLDVKGKISIDKFKASNATMQEVLTEFTVNRGVAELNSFTSNLYQGSIKASAQLDARNTPASYWAKKQIKGVEVLPLLIDVADNDMLSGTGNIDVDVKGQSLTQSGIKQNLSGVVKINFADGAVNGINIAQVIRVNYAKIKGQSVDETVAEEKKTDFSALTATLNLAKGVMTTNDFSASSPLLRISGEGDVNYIQETMDLLLNTSLVGSLEGQGGEGVDDLKDITIPVRVYNQWTDPKYKVEFDQLWKQLESEKKEELKKKAEEAKQELEEKAQKELNRALGDAVSDDDAKELTDKLLKGLFN
ncbi:AsmA family protein [Vibrio sp. MA40-2]|uniref:AsmA family protein n=1 Tax=Vibrio sp. MA40-2 TaxID=3391828 RepID=UPI0039A753C2